MSEAKKGSESRLRRRAAQSTDTETGSGIPSEMKKQMEAAKERMKRYHAVYGQTAHSPGGASPDAPNRPEDR